MTLTYDPRIPSRFLITARYQLGSVTISADTPEEVLRKLATFGVDWTVKVFDEAGNDYTRVDLERVRKRMTLSCDKIIALPASGCASWLLALRAWPTSMIRRRKQPSF